MLGPTVQVGAVDIIASLAGRSNEVSVQYSVFTRFLFFPGGAEHVPCILRVHAWSVFSAAIGFRGLSIGILRRHCRVGPVANDNIHPVTKVEPVEITTHLAYSQLSLSISSRPLR